MSAAHPLERLCPKCGASPGVPCQGKRGDRKAMHRERRTGVWFKPQAAADDADTESPIELALLQAIRGWLFHNDCNTVAARTQVKVGPYRADILLTDAAGAGRKLVVECDGRDWHSTESQVEKDKRRDRWFAAQGIPCMRFTGAEIHRDARGCAAQVGQWVRSA